MAKQALSLSYGQAFVARERGHPRTSMAVRDEAHEPGKGVCALISGATWQNTIAARAADLGVRAFLADYYATPAHWDVKASATRVLQALNGWCHGQSRHVEEGSYVCSLSVLILCDREGHLFHLGDTLVFRLRGAEFEQLSRDHVTELGGYRYPSRALGMDANLDVDYLRLPLKQGDIFLFATQAVRGTLMPSDYVQLIRSDVSDLDAACERLAAAAQTRAAERGYSADQFCFQLVRIDRLAEPGGEAESTSRPASGLPLPPELEAGSRLDGFEVCAVLERTPQTRLYHVRDERSGREMALKAPSPELSSRSAYLEHFLLQQWVLERVRSPYLVEALSRSRPPRHLYYLFALPRGETLREWMKRYPRASLAQRLDIARQLTKGVMALHRHDVLHQRLHPDNILLDPHGQVLLNDLSACHRRDGDGYRSARELARQIGLNEHSAPEYALDTDVGRRSDQYALASTIYWLLTGRLPYNTVPHRLRSHTGLERMRYRSARLYNSQVSPALDEALRRALDPQRALRFRRLSEFLRALREPRPIAADGPAWRQPANLWQGVAAILLLLLVLSWLLK